MILDGNNPYTGPSFSFSNRVARGLWGVVWLLCFRISPRPFNFWRVFLLRIFGAKIGRSVNFNPSVKIWAPWNLSVGDFVGFGEGVVIYDMAKISIGDFAVISQWAHLCAGSHDYNSINFQLVAKPINIGPHAWICTEAFVGLGVDIPAGVIVAARSVLVKSPNRDWSIYAGHPAVFLKERSKNVDQN